MTSFTVTLNLFPCIIKCLEFRPFLFHGKRGTMGVYVFICEIVPKAVP